MTSGVHVYNTLGRQLQTLETRETGAIGIYVCGPTVQSRPHLGHGRAAVAFDVIRRYLEWRGYRVTYVTNITDVEDKIIEAAAEEGMSVSKLAERMSDLFLQTYRTLDVLEPDVLPKATEHIPDMIELIERLIERELAYAVRGDVYFSVRSFPGYGRLSGRKLDELLAGARVGPGEHKRDPLDFALWKAAKPGEPSWDSPWGPGRPGWHIECSAMATRYLGFGFEIHGGGEDLIFPHHENEIAQSEGAEGMPPFARYWLHNGMVNLGGEKMAKSTGNLVDLVEVLERHTPEAVRLLYLRTHYRSPLEFTEESLRDAEGALERLRGFRRRMGGSVDELPDAELIGRFREAMDDDFGTPQAVAVLFEAVREGNRRLDEAEEAGPWVAAFDEIAEVLGILPAPAAVDDLDEDLRALAAELGVEAAPSPAGTIERLLEEREDARGDEDWDRADRIRDDLGALGIVVEDTPGGSRWHRR